MTYINQKAGAEPKSRHNNTEESLLYYIRQHNYTLKIPSVIRSYLKDPVHGKMDDMKQ